MVCFTGMTRHNSILIHLPAICTFERGLPYLVVEKPANMNSSGLLLSYCKTLIFILVTILSAFPVSAQKKEGMPLIDSLLIQVPKASDDTNKVHLLLRISDAYIFYMQDSLNCEYYLRRAKALAEKLNFIHGIKEANGNFYSLYRLQSNSGKAMGYLLNNADL